LPVTLPMPAPSPADADRWPLALVPRQVPGRAGVQLVAGHEADSSRRGPFPGASARPHGGSTRGKPAPPDPSQPARAPRVLLVDDAPAIRVVLRDLLDDAGLDVVGEAADGLQGVAQAEALRPDVVLMDWRMPGLNGLQATARIRQVLPQAQVVMFSHIEGREAEAVARQAGASAFVPKGSPAAQICAAVLAACGRSSPPQPPLDSA
jgi:CheY-like chemotaxis protein